MTGTEVTGSTGRLGRARHRLLLLPALATALTCAGCSGAGSGPVQDPFGAAARAHASATPGEPTGDQGRPVQPYGDAAFPAYAATAVVARVAVHDSLDGPVSATLGSPQPSGAPLVFLLADRQGGWLRVFLPTRPNGSTGWIRASDVKVQGVSYHLVVRRGAHRLDVYRRDTLLHSYPVGIGTRETPTPGGVFYLKELLRPTNPDRAYGPYAYGLSGFSNTLSSYAGGDGVIGLHGTNEPASVGKDVSHGCIRLRNADITTLARLLPLGTPVYIQA